jgi:acetyl esterase/lipase
MPSQAMEVVIEVLRSRQKASDRQAAPTLEELRATFTPGAHLHPIPDDVRISEVTAGGVPAHWLTAPGADAARALLFLHGGGTSWDRCAATASWPRGWDGPAGCGCCSLNIAWPPSIPSRRPSTTSWPHGVGCAPTRV